MSHYCKHDDKYLWQFCYCQRSVQPPHHSGCFLSISGKLSCVHRQFAFFDILRFLRVEHYRWATTAHMVMNDFHAFATFNSGRCIGHGVIPRFLSVKHCWWAIRQTWGYISLTLSLPSKVSLISTSPWMFFRQFQASSCFFLSRYFSFGVEVWMTHSKLFLNHHIHLFIPGEVTHFFLPQWPSTHDMA